MQTCAVCETERADCSNISDGNFTFSICNRCALPVTLAFCLYGSLRMAVIEALHIHVATDAAHGLNEMADAIPGMQPYRHCVTCHREIPAGCPPLCARCLAESEPLRMH
jgi:hypothetical protein